MKNNDVSPALCRMLGFLGFMFSLGFFILINKVFNLEISMLGFASLGAKGWALLIVSGIVGLVFMAVGWGIGINIQIKSEYVNSFIGSIWHFLAHGTLCWVVLWGIFLSLKYGQEGGKEFVRVWVEREGGLMMIIQAFGWGIVASFFAGIISGLAYSRLGVVLIGVLVSFLVGAYLQKDVYGMESASWILIGFLTAFMSVILTASMFSKDRKERTQIRKRDFG